MHIPAKFWYNDSLIISIDDTPVRTINKVCHVQIVDAANNVLRTYKQPLTEEELSEVINEKSTGLASQQIKQVVLRIQDLQALFPNAIDYDPELII